MRTSTGIITTRRTCEEHGKCTVTWDYVDQGGCPVCEELDDCRSDLRQAGDEIDELRSEADEGDQQYAELEARNKGLEKQITEYRASLKDIKAELKRLNNVTGDNKDD